MTTVPASEVAIRAFEQSDRRALRRISIETAFAGRGYESFFEDGEILADFLTLYFTDYEPESTFVADDAGAVAGYLLGSRDSARMQRVFRRRILAPLLLKAFLRGSLFKPKARQFLWNIFGSYRRGEFREPDFSTRYPAVLHINLDQRYRGGGIGRRLVDTYLVFLKRYGIPGVHLATISEKACHFFQQCDFRILHKAKRSYLRYAIGQDVPVFIMGRRVF